MAPMSARDEYAELMKHNGDGHYLYTPQKYSLLHPGSVGFFDQFGIWTQITDLSVKGQAEKDGFKGIDDDLVLGEPDEAMWKTVSSGSEAETSFGLEGGLSGALSAAPVDVSANAKNKSGSTGKAALITTEKVKNQRFTGAPGPSIAQWVKDNAKTLVKSKYGDYIKDFGLWAIHTTWSTPECAITLDSAHSRDTSAGVDVGGTGLGKIGASGSSLKKLESKGWRTYEAKEADQGLVVSYGGAGFRLHKIQMFRGNNVLKQTERTAGNPDDFYKLAYDEAGNQIEPELYRHVRDENGEIVGEVKVDVEGERKAREEAAKKEAEGIAEEEDDEVFISSEPVGISAEEAGVPTKLETTTIDTKPAVGGVSDFDKKMDEAKKIPDEALRKAEMLKLFKANVTTTTETVVQ
ncbi:unnamed protein product [Penicillium pancosmium]